MTLRSMRNLRIFALAALSLYAAAAVYMGVEQRSFLFRRAPAFIPVEIQPSARARDVSFTTRDGTVLRGWRVSASRSDALTYLYFHGNADGLDERAERFALMSADGSGLVAFSYRGYGGSGGEPSEQHLLSDATELYAMLSAEVGENRLVVFGESLGSGVALGVVRGKHPKAIVLDSPYLSVLHRAQASYPWLPVSLLLKDTFRSDLFIGAVRSPILILHGTEDSVVPPADSAALAAMAPPGLVTRKLYAGEPHVVPYDRGPVRDVPAFLAAIPSP